MFWLLGVGLLTLATAIAAVRWQLRLRCRFGAGALNGNCLMWLRGGANKPNQDVTLIKLSYFNPAGTNRSGEYWLHWDHSPQVPFVQEIHLPVELRNLLDFEGTAAVKQGHVVLEVLTGDGEVHTLRRPLLELRESYFGRGKNPPMLVFLPPIALAAPIESPVIAVEETEETSFVSDVPLEAQIAELVVEAIAEAPASVAIAEILEMSLDAQTSEEEAPMITVTEIEASSESSLAPETAIAATAFVATEPPLPEVEVEDAKPVPSIRDLIAQRNAAARAQGPTPR